MARKQKTIHYLYKTTCLVTNRYYIGMHSTCNLDDGYMGSGKRLRYSMRKHGVDNHKKEIIEFFESRELLIEAEKEAITPDMIIDDMCMNIMSGGTGGFISEEQQRHRAICARLANTIKRTTDKEWFDNYKKNTSIALKKGYENGIRNKKWRKDWTGLTHSNDSKQLMSESSKGIGTGETNSQFGTCWITKEGLNKKIKKEDIDKWLIEGWLKGRK